MEWAVARQLFVVDCALAGIGGIGGCAVPLGIFA